MVLDAWDQTGSRLVTDSEQLETVIRLAASHKQAQGPAVIIPRDATAAAVVSPAFEVLACDPAFAEWFGHLSDNFGLRRLVRAAIRKPGEVSLIEAEDERVIATCATPGLAAESWPLSPACKVAAALPRAVVLLAYAPTRASRLAQSASRTYGLSPLESRLAEALIDAPNLDLAARRTGVGRETARDALRNIMRKTGARRTPDVVRRMVDLMCGSPAPADNLETLLQGMFDATPAEARAAAHFAAGLTAREVAGVLGVKETTVRGHLKTVFSKTGLRKAKDLVRLAVESSALSGVTSSGEALVEPTDPSGQLRIFARPDNGRRVAFVDYGPKSGKPVLVQHGSSTGRSLPAEFVRLLHLSGWRPIVPQRPGYGQTDPAVSDQLLESSQDQILLLDHLKVASAVVLAKDAGAAAAIELTCRNRDRIRRLIIFNPRPPNDAPRPSTGIIAAISNLMRDKPQMIESFAELMRRQSSTRLVESVVRRSLNVHEADRRIIEDPTVLAHIVHDTMALGARTAAGIIAEQTAYAQGWTPPEMLAEIGWTVCWGDWVDNEPGQMEWAARHGAKVARITNAGLLATYTNPAGVVRILDEGEG